MMEGSGRTSTLAMIGEAWVQALEFAACLLELGRAELGEKFAMLGRAVGFLVGAAIGLLLGIIFLLIGLAHLLVAFGIRPDAAFFLVGGSIALLSIGIALKARSDLSVGGLTPRRTIDQFRSFVRSTGQAHPDGR